MTEHADVFRNGFSRRHLAVSINQESGLLYYHCIINLLLYYYHCTIVLSLYHFITLVTVVIVSLPEEKIRELLLSSGHLFLPTEKGSVTGEQRHNLHQITKVSDF